MRPLPLSLSPFPSPLAWAVLLPGLVAAYLLYSAIPETSGTLPPLAERFSFFGLGVVGAIFANSTGAGGGVVFLPVFAKLGLTESQAVATSFGIQCFGMSAGALTWTYFYRQRQRSSGQWSAFTPVVVICAVSSIAGLWTVHGIEFARPASVTLLFAVFSLFLGASILLASGRGELGPRHSLAPADMIVLIAVAYTGGIITAWLSVGVGEMVAFYLILRRFDATFAVAVAVVISALTVWSAAPQQLLIGDQAYWQIIAFAGPGAIIGGLIARPLVQRLGARRLKTFFGCWLLLIGVAELVPLFLLA